MFESQVQKRDDRWIALAENQFDLPDRVLETISHMAIA